MGVIHSYIIDFLIEALKISQRNPQMLFRKISLDNLTSNDRQARRSNRKDLEEIGISVDAFELNHDLIIDWFKRSLEAGGFEEHAAGQDGELYWCPAIRFLFF